MTDETPRAHRIAAYVAFGWAIVLLLWAIYNCFWQVGFGEFMQGLVYYGVGDGSGASETFNLNWALVYTAGGVLVLRGNTLGRGIVIGGAAIEGYNRLRSLTGALFDEKQNDWFTSTTQGILKLATFGLGFVVTAALIILLLRNFTVYEPWQPPVNPWTQQAQAVRQANQQQAPVQQPYAAPQQQQAPVQQPYAAPQQQPYPANPYAQPQPHQQGYGYPQQAPHGFPPQGYQPQPPQQ
ncbi:hypothetical protein [Streptomyces sp. NBC_00503]|uniref:hypothetical protein n=1 Tax=Streptomyces sp. NBC_00503 TaxID=2903659 RepID=UPI002E817E23|nr:hypothetical protein [Streptomyces sp. NBC_00503]WUD79405.1 hypothetical protein OG490_01785 [Streptomyces sp. NBC_00503]